MKFNMLFLVFLFSVSSFFVSTCVAADDSDTWYHIPVIVNIASGTQMTDAEVKAMIAKTNAVLRKAKIHLYVADTNDDYKVGNGDSQLTEDEGDKAVEDGHKEIAKSDPKTKKGMKVTIGDNVWVEDANNPLGWAKHRTRVAVIRDTNDPNAMGRTLAHELCHNLTLNYDYDDVNDANQTGNLMWEDDMYDGEELSEEQKKEIRKRAKKWGKVGVEPAPIVPPKPTRASHVTYGGSRYKYYPWGVVLDDANETPVIIYDPVVLPHDIVWTEIESEGNGLPDDKVEIGIIPAGLIEAIHEYLLQYRVKFDFDNDQIPEVVVKIDIDTHGGVVTYGDAIIEAPEGNLLGHTPIILDTHYKLRDYAGEIKAVAEAEFTSIDLELSVMDFAVWGQPQYFEPPYQVMVESEIHMADSNTSFDETGWFEVDNYSSASLDEVATVQYLADPNPSDPLNPHQIPDYLVKGEGFAGDVEVFVDGRYIATVMADPDGKIAFPVTADMMSVGETFVEAIATDGSGKRVFSYFLNKEPVEGDLDGDYDVDFEDFARLADNWLVSLD